jgi:class 3 adenylate cyclase/tetratricopeptide (TPR) repeat protein
MTFDEILAQLLDLLRRQGRVSYRALKRRFALDDDYLEDLKAELIDAQHLAVDEDGKVLVWLGGPATAGVSASEEGRAPLSYTPKHLADKILTSRSALEGERKQVTVLFADLKGSMELLADRDPEEARQLLDPVLERMMEAVHRYEGTVNQVMGDGIMALFGAPIAHEEHAVRACYAALAMQTAIRSYAEEVRRGHGIAVQIRVGLNSGVVVVRAIGNDLHMDYSAIGETTHLAGRMEQLAAPGSILLTGETLRLAEGLVQVKSLGPVPVRGLVAAVEVFELVGAGPTRTRLQAMAVRGLTRFVGRQTELEALRQAQAQARAGHGQVVAVIGEPGVGKTRFFYEFTQSHRIHGWLLLESSSVSYGKATAYLPIRDLLKAYFQIEDRDDARRVREKLTGKLLTLDAALGPSLPAFLSLLDMPIEDAQWQALDPAQRRQRTLDAIKRLLLRESQVQPLLLIFEDLHWIDAETQALLDSLVESLPTARMLLLVNYRPEYQHGWGSKTYYVQLRLDALPPESAQELLDALLGNDAGLQPLKQRLIERTEGNPFFLEESVRTLVETQVLVGERGAYRLAQAPPSIQVPATVQAVLTARIDRLSPEEKRLLQAAAVIGTEVPFALLHAIAEVPEEELRRGLAYLQAAEFLYETRLFPELEYTFKHALTHQVAYGNLLQERRRALHARIVDALEALYADRLADQVEQLAHHAFRAEVWDKALPCCRQAGAKAAARSTNREAVAYLEQALMALQHLPESRETREQAIDLRFDLRNALLLLGEQGRILGHLREAEGLAKTLDDRRRLGRVASYMGDYFWRMGHHDRAIEVSQQALTLGLALEDFGLQVQANFYLGRAYVTLGNYGRAMDVLRRNVAVLEGDLIREYFGLTALPAILSRAYLAWCLAELGAFAEGIATGEEGVRIARTVDHPYSLLIATGGVGMLYFRKGALHQAISMLEGGLELCRVWNIRDWFPLIAATLGAAYALAGRVTEALPLLEQAVEQATAMGIMFAHSLRIAWQGEAALRDDRRQDAVGLARRAYELSCEQKERGHQAWALRLLGEIHAQGDAPEVEQAEHHYQQAHALADGLGMRPLLAHCHLGLGTLYLNMSRRDQASAELSAAIDLYRAMEMTFWLSRAEAELVKLG